jgi:cell division septal protein FtsQ
MHFTRLVKNAFLYVVIGVVFLALLAFLLFSSRFAINKIEVSRDDLHTDNSNIVSLLSEFKGQSIFTFSKSKANQLIQENYPEFARVEVKKLFPNTIKINLVTHEIVANIKAFYTLPKVETVVPEESKQIQEVGEALKAAFDLGSGPKTENREELTPIEQKALLNRIGQAIFGHEEDLQLMTITVEGLSQPIEDRQVVIPEKNMDFIINSTKYLANLMQMEVASIQYLPIARDVHLKMRNNLVLWLSTEKDYKEQIDKLNTIYKVAELDKEDIAYIDLRIREKIIYCPHGERCDHYK